MKRLNFTLDDETIALLDVLAKAYYGGNKSQTVRAALESLAAHIGHEGWVVAGYTPVVADAEVACHTCHTRYRRGDVLYRPVFERGRSPQAFPHIPSEAWLDCTDCAEQQFAG